MISEAPPVSTATTVTFLLTDIQGSTRHWEASPDRMRRALELHDRLVREAIVDEGGRVLTTHGEGDSFFAVFPHAPEAVAAACRIQANLGAQPWPDDVRLQVRMALHSGEAGGDYRGQAANRCAKVRGCGHGGQVLLSGSAAELARERLPAGVRLLDLGKHRLRDLPGQERIFQLAIPGLPATFPPLKSLRVGENARLEVLEHVRRHWLQTELGESLSRLARIELGLAERPGAVDNSLQAVLRRPAEPDRLLDRGMPISAVYRQLGKQLLILGEPGAGKTTMLLELAEQLLDELEDPSTEPMPIVFHLSSWAVERRDLEAWLVDELHVGYGVSRRLGQTWIESDQVIPLLDGLDEMAPEHRDTCIAAINRFHDAHGLLPLVVCSRLAEYEARRTKLQLRGAFMIQPLTQADIEVFLQQAGETLAGVREVLRADRQLSELLTTPLFLSIVALAYKGRPASAVRASGNLEDRRKRILGDYVDTMFARPRAAPTPVRHKLPQITDPRRQRSDPQLHFSREQTLRWLQWLASQVVRRPDQGELFFIERMQPDWLPETGRGRWMYRTAVGALIYGSVTGQAISVVLGVSIMLITLVGRGSHTDIGGLLRTILVWFLLITVFGSMAGALVGGLRTPKTMRINPIEVVSWSWRRFWQKTAQCLAIGVVGWLTLRLLEWVTTAKFGQLDPVWAAIAVFILPYCLVGGFVNMASRILSKLVDDRGRRVLNRGDLVRASLTGGATGIAIAAATSLIEQPVELVEARALPGSIASMVSGLAGSGIGGLLVGLVVGLANGWSGKQLHSDRLLKPGQGVWQAARNGLSVGLCGGVVTGLWAGIIYAELSRLQYGTFFAVAGGATVGSGVALVVGAVLGLRNGGNAFIKHVVLRWLLCRGGCLPWRYATFLDYAAERAFLRKVGGGYMVVHALLRDYFADLHVGLDSLPATRLPSVD